jgi:aromatic amino acid aminotransferase I
MDPMALQLSTSLQYAAGTGHPLLAQFLREFVQKVYRPGYADFEVL